MTPLHSDPTGISTATSEAPRPRDTSRRYRTPARRLGLAVVAGASAVALAACGSGSGTSGGSGGEVDTTELSIAYSAQPGSLDPHISTAEATFDFMRGVYEGLVALDDEGVPQPQLAESIDTNEDYSEYTFHLREGITFHDGSALDAQDVVDTMERWTELAPAGGSFSDVTWEAVDDLTVTMTSPVPFYAALTLMANHQNQYPAVTTSEAIEAAGPEGLGEFVGTGPYSFVEWVDSQYVKLEKNEDYVPYEVDSTGGASPSEVVYDTVTLNVVSDPSTRVSGLQSGEYDIASHILSDQIPQVEGAGAQQETFGKGLSGMYFNLNEGPMADKNLRHAVLTGLDMEAILTGAYGGPDFFTVEGAIATELQTNWYTDAGTEEYNVQDQELAQEYLEKSDYDGEPVRLNVTRDYQDHYDTAVVVEQQLNEMGIAAELVVSDWPTVLATAKDEPGAWEISFSSWSPQSMPTRYTFQGENASGALIGDPYYEAVKAVHYTDSLESAQTALDEQQTAFYDFLPAIIFGKKTGTVGYSADLAPIQIQEGAGSMGLWYLATPAG
ncbi:ABC transporter substrate-binding protein [Brevibacterium litoralis]|uniref:ABC transporter substrate-binding protein n=1 Tax=Brevibacterium litoralis TaxID=3138935 RepID=UPI0032F0676C